MKKSSMINFKIITILCIILAVMCFLYGSAVYMTGSGTGFFVIWYAIGLFLIIVGIVYEKELWAKFPGWLRIAVTICLTLGLAIWIITQALVISGLRSKGPDGLDYIIVLGAQVRTTGPSVVTKYRLDAAIDYLTNNPDTKVIVSGGQGYNEPAPEADIMGAYLSDHGIAEDRIIYENKSLDTSENIAFSSRFLDIENDTIGIVTNNFHVWRGVHLAKAYGYKHVYGIAADSHPIYLPNNMLRESVGIMKDLVFGNLL